MKKRILLIILALLVLSACSHKNKNQKVPGNWYTGSSSSTSASDKKETSDNSIYDVVLEKLRTDTSDTPATHYAYYDIDGNGQDELFSGRYWESTGTIEFAALYYDNNGVALLDSFFTVSSIITTTGFATANFDLWPQLSRFILVAIMICGASAGSTGGGVKVSRMIIMAKAIKREIISVISPRKVKTITMDGKPISEVVIKNTLTYFCVYWFIAIGSMFLLTVLEGFNTEVTVTAVMACINNIGPGLDMVGPAGNFSMFSPLSKIILSLNMLIGRLEIWPMLLLFTPSVYKNASRK